MPARRTFVAIALVGAGLMVVASQTVARPGRPVARISVGGGQPPLSISPTTEPALLPPAAAATTTPAPPPVPVTVTARHAAAPPVRAAASPAPPAPAHAVTPTALATGSGHTITSSGLWLMARDGSGLRRLSADRPLWVAWSPDERHVALARSSGIDILDVADGSMTRLATFLGSVVYVAWSPSGQLIAADVMYDPYAIPPNGAPHTDLVIVGAATGTSTSLGPVVGAGHPTWSVTGCLGWGFSAVEIWCPGRPLLSLPPFPGSAELAWSPDGTRYAITSSEDAAPGAIRTYAADGSGQVDLGDHRAFNLQWANDGRTILFQSWDDKNGQVWAQPVGGGPASLLLSGGFPFALNGVDDGVIFDTGHALGHNTIWSMTVSNPTPHQLVTVSAGGGAVGRITWARDGRWLLVDAVPSA